MAIIEKNRVIRPTTNDPSGNYRVHCDNVGEDDILRINITHESNPTVHFIFEVNGQALASLNSIHFKAVQFGSHWHINWVQDINIRQIQ